jgi:hypothetical protein
VFQCVDHWERRLNLSADQHAASMLYTTIHCANFRSELGQPFNTDATTAIDQSHYRHLLAVLSGICSGMERCEMDDQAKR